jgi:hypothetical protein
MRGSIVTLVVTATALLASPTRALAVSDWDPDDVRGGFDLRWFGATYVENGDISLVVSFYPGFHRSDLPRKGEGQAPGVWFDIDEYFTGWFYRHDGGVRFGYGDLGSTCCLSFPVRIVSPLVLRVRFPAIDEGQPGIPIRGESRWRWRHGPHDWTARVVLPANG